MSLQNNQAHPMQEFINQWVAPYYLAILHGNYYYQLSDDERFSFNKSVNNALLNINSEIVIQLLSGEWGGWREQITGSWFCGIKGWSQFADIIGKELVESKMTYAGQGLSFALACFANEKSVHYLMEYLDVYLPQINLVYDQDWVMPALMWVDEQNKTNYATRYLVPNGLWENYVASKSLELSKCKENFWNLMKYCQEHFANPKAG